MRPVATSQISRVLGGAPYNTASRDAEGEREMHLMNRRATGITLERLAVNGQRRTMMESSGGGSVLVAGGLEMV
jgi:hypothetical protein